MKTLSQLLIISSIGLAATPAIAQSEEAKGVVINFEYKASELTSVNSRLSLMKRMKKEALSACSGRKSIAYKSKKECAADLEAQFVSAIGNPTLSALHEGKAIKVALKAS